MKEDMTFTKVHGQRFSAIMCLTIRLQFFLFAVISCRTCNVSSAGFDSMFCCIKVISLSLSILSTWLAVFRLSFLSSLGFLRELSLL